VLGSSVARGRWSTPQGWQLGAQRGETIRSPAGTTAPAPEGNMRRHPARVPLGLGARTGELWLGHASMGSASKEEGLPVGSFNGEAAECRRVASCTSFVGHRLRCSPNGAAMARDVSEWRQPWRSSAQLGSASSGGRRSAYEETRKGGG
jgi:hypothetical protein